MKMALRAACAAMAVAIAGCGGENQQGAAPGGESIAADGSSTVFPLTEAAAEAFTNSARGGARVTVGESGTGGGFRKFCRGETQVQNASRPISSEEMAACTAANIEYVEIPIAFDGITIVVHPNNPVTGMTLAELRRTWEPAAGSTIVRWNQINRAFPSTDLLLFGPGTASGTFDFFTEAVNGEGGASRTDFTPSEDDNVIVQGVASNPGGMGYFGYAYFDQNRERLKALSVDGVAPSPETIASGDYPLARPMFVYVSAEALRRPQVQRFVQFYVNNAATLAPQVGYVPLPPEAYATYAARARDIETGTAFGGHSDIDASIAELLTRPLSHEAVE